MAYDEDMQFIRRSKPVVLIVDDILESGMASAEVATYLLLNGAREVHLAVETKVGDWHRKKPLGLKPVLRE